MYSNEILTNNRAYGNQTTWNSENISSRFSFLTFKSYLKWFVENNFWEWNWTNKQTMKFIGEVFGFENRQNAQSHTIPKKMGLIIITLFLYFSALCMPIGRIRNEGFTHANTLKYLVGLSLEIDELRLKLHYLTEYRAFCASWRTVFLGLSYSFATANQMRMKISTHSHIQHKNSVSQHWYCWRLYE